jgi:Uncharacterized protein conserved in bacteria (DUF2252)
MDIVRSTEKYEAWLGERIPLIQADLDRKHALMSEAAFPFLRATFYRWAQIVRDLVPNIAPAPEVLGVGDLHVENFGTWRDVEGRLIWGINDFDEACWIPYTCDLVRLTTSAHLAIAIDHLHISAARASRAILEGYLAGLAKGGRPFALAEHHTALREAAVERLKQPELFWKKLNDFPTWKGRIPSSAMKALRRMMPEGDVECRVVHRLAGLGSLGRRRFVALAQWRGGSIAREAKELAESAWMWANARRPGKTELFYQEALDRARRAPDPFVKVRAPWLVLRLAPDCSRIELSSLPEKHDSTRLLQAMGFETANVHLGSRDAEAIQHDLKKRPVNWLHTAAQAMAESVNEDWKQWRKVR